MEGSARNQEALLPRGGSGLWLVWRTLLEPPCLSTREKSGLVSEARVAWPESTQAHLPDSPNALKTSSANRLSTSLQNSKLIAGAINSPIIGLLSISKRQNGFRSGNMDGERSARRPTRF